MHCNITQATTVKDWVLRHTTPLTHINFFLLVCVVGGCLVRAPKWPPPLIMPAVSPLPAESFLFHSFPWPFSSLWDDYSLTAWQPTIGRDNSSSSIVPIINHFHHYGYNLTATTSGRCRLAFGRWGRLVGFLYYCTERLAFGCISNLCGRAWQFSFL